jgi:hypothetical protein
MNPLDQLADITTPQNVSIWPLAWGYWLVLALAILLLAIAIISVVRFKNTRKQKRGAMAALNSLETLDPYFAHKVHVLIKTLVAHYMPHVASKTMHGSEWQSLLLSVYKGNHPSEVVRSISMLQARMYAKPPASLEAALPSKEATADDLQNVVRAQNDVILTAMRDFVDTSFPCKVPSNKHTAVAKTSPPSPAKKVSHV